MYLLSQIFTIINYSIIGSTYFVNNKKKILILNIINSTFELLADLLLGGYTGISMCVVAIIRNIYVYINSDMNKRKRLLSCLLFFILIILLSIFTYNGIFSLLIVFATLVYTYSIFQEKTLTYKILGIPNQLLCVSYNIYLYNISGIILETLLLICSLLGYYLEYKSKFSKKSPEKS